MMISQTDGQWATQPFGEFATFRNGLNYSASDVGEGLKLIGVSNFQDNLTISYSDLQRVQGFDHLKDEDLLNNNDLLFVRSNGNRALIGRVLFIQNLHERVGHSGFTIKARVSSPRLCPLFAALFFSSDLAKSQIFKHGSGTNISNLSQDILSTVQIPIPPLPAQDAIVSLLMTWDRGIRQLTDLIAAKVRFKQGLMQQLLTGNRRFSTLTADWVGYRLGELFSEREEVNRPDLPLLSITADRGVIPRSDVDRKDTSNQNKSLYKRIASGDIGYNTMRMWQGVSAFSKYEGIVSPAYTICIPGIHIDGDFAGYLFKYPPVVHRFHRFSQGLVDDTLNLKFHHFAQIHVRIPPVNEQKRIVEVFHAIDREIELLRKQLEALKQQKKGLMQKLLTGEVRVKMPKGVA